MTPPKAFVVGHPIKHSRSPLIHGYWLREHGLDGSYERVDVAARRFRRSSCELCSERVSRRQCHHPAQGGRFRARRRATDRARRLAGRQHALGRGRRASTATTPMSSASSPTSTRALGRLGPGGPDGAGARRRRRGAGCHRGAPRPRRRPKIIIANRTDGRAQELAAFSIGPDRRALAWQRDCRGAARAGRIFSSTPPRSAWPAQPPLDLDLAGLPR